MFEKVREIIVDTLSCEMDEVTMEADLTEDLGADSLDAVELNIALEEQLGLSIADEDRPNLKTVGDIVRYLEDEDGNRIGFVLMEDGEECEYLYVEDDEEDADRAGEDEDNPYDLGITKEGVAEATNDMNAIYKDGIAVAAELKGAFDDIKGAFDFGSFLKK